MPTHHRFTMDEVTKQVMQCRLISLMIEDCASMVNLAAQHGNLPTMGPRMQEMLADLKTLASDASDDLNFMVWETTSKAPVNTINRED